MIVSRLQVKLTGQMRVALLVQDDILRLDVAMNDFHRVYVLQGGAQAGHIERHVPLVEHDLLAQIVAQVAAALEIQHQIARGAR